MLLLLALLLAPYGAPQEVFRFADERIAESSGLVASSTDDGVLYTHNDSGDEARFFAVGLDGRTRAVFVLPGQDARDWEDIARGPDEQGRSSLWLGDIGDNRARRDRGLLVHRVPEPDPAATGTVPVTATSFRLVYEDGPRDAEALLVTADGRLHVVSKALAGRTSLYAAPERLDPSAPNVLRRVGEVSAPFVVTAGDVSPDGGRVVLRGLDEVGEWEVRGDLAAALAEEPVVTELGLSAQGESVAYRRDGRAVYVGSEGEAAPVHVLVAGEPPAPPQDATPVAQDGWPLRLAVTAAVAAGLLAVLVLVRRARRVRGR